MKAILKGKGRRLFAFLMCALTIIGIMPMNAFAFTAQEGQKVSSYNGDYYVGYDGDYYYALPRNYIRYDDDGDISVHSSQANYKRKKYMIKNSSGATRVVYCIESGIPYEDSDNSYTSKSGENSQYFQNLPYSAQYGIMLTSVYGWQPGKTVPVSGCNTDDYILATQILMWEYQQLIRTSPTNLSDNAYGVAANSYVKTIEGRPAKKCYDWILAQMAQHTTIPSFASSKSSSATVYTLKYDSSTKKYSLTLTDSNNTLSDLKFASGSGITVSRSGNKYTLTSSKMIENAVTVTAQKNISGVNNDMLIWGRVGYQTMMCGAEDPVVFYLKIKTETTGVGHIVKHSEDGKVEGIRFTVSGNGVNKTVTTKANGTVDLELMPGVYTVTEQTENKYEPQSVQRVTIVSGGTSTVTFSNVLKRGDLTVTKTAEDGLSEGAKFHLFGTSLSGLAVDEYATVGKDGNAYFKDVLIGSGYVLEEVDTAIRYVVPKNQTAAIEWNKVTNKTMDNVLKKWKLTVTKSDSETGTEQGDASLAGAVYGVYKGDQLIDEYTTDANGQFTTKYYICDEDWSLREISASEGYLVTSGSEHIGAEAKLYTAEYNSTALDVIETVQKGKIAIIKHTDNGETQIETPETGAEFEVFLKKSGSYANAKESEKDYLVCDENGYACTKELPYGIYTVKQTKGWEGKELMDAFDVFVAKDGEVYRYLINNAPFESYIKIVKTDSTTGKTIPYAGAAFQIFRPDGSKVEMTYTYPEVTTIDTFYTTAEGMLITPEKLPYGAGYSLVEVSAPYGYVLDTTPVYFDVTEDASSEESAITIIKVEKQNKPQMGVINVTKTGEAYSSAVQTDDVYQPVYRNTGLEGAVYEVTATEDVYTLDGTLRYTKGEVVDTITTDKEGNVKTAPLYLGTFEVKEIESPYGMVLSDEIHTVELTYAGQEVEINEIHTAFYNERQKATISLEKMMSKDEKFKIGMNDEILTVQFGLFAEEDLTATDGTVIPADALVEVAACDENGSLTFETDIPVGAKLYVKELAVDNHYILSDTKYAVEFVYAGQDTAFVEIKANDGQPIENELIYGNIHGLKVDRETEKTIEGAVFGLFRTDAEAFTEDTALLTATSDENGVFSFENVPYGNWYVKELAPAEGYLPNEEIYVVQVAEHEQVIEITVVNDRIPEIGTKAEVDGEKEICATEIFTLTDTVSYKHLVPGKEYVLNGVLMDKNTGKALVLDGKEVTAETVFTPESPNGEVTVAFTFDARYIKEDTDIVVFESLSRDGKELAVHADIEDEGQTVTVKVPKIGTKATVNGKKALTTNGEVTIEDIVSYKNLTVGKEYTVKGVLMDKATGKELLIDGKPVTSETTFTPETSGGEVKMTFTFNAEGLTKMTEIVVFETVYRDGTEIAVHADINDDGQTVRITPPTPPAPQTGDDSNLGFWIGLGGIALGGLVATTIMYFKKKKDDDEE